MMRLRVPVTFLAFAFIASAARAQDDSGWEDVLKSHSTGQTRRDALKEARDKFTRRKQSQLRQAVEELNAQKTELERTQESGVKRSGDVEYTAFEPAEPARVADRPPAGSNESDLWIWDPSTEHFDYFRHDIWSLKPQDFRFWRPTRVMIEKPLAARNAVEKKEFVSQLPAIQFRDVFLAIPFALTNSLDKDVKMGPHFWLVSENLRFTEETAGFIAKEDVERSMFSELKPTFDLVSYVKENADGATEPVQILGSGETRYGVAIFPLPDPELDLLTLVIDGLNNTYRFDRKQKRVLAIDFEHKGDEFYAQKQSFKFMKKEWRWMWMWYEEMQVSAPERFEFETPSGLRDKPKVHWAYQVTLTNSTGEKQYLKVRQWNTTVKVRAMGVEIEVALLDDGKSTIHKARVMEEMAQQFTGDRFFAGTLDAEQTKVFPVIFDVEDVDWDSVYEQVEAKLTGDISIGYGVEPLKPGVESFMPDRDKLGKVKQFKLDDEQKKQIRDEVTEAIGPALQREQERRMISADVSAESGIASGTYRIVRSYFRKGVIESNWIHQWSEFE
jgi:Spy/CpxP family protein refolding chaperone